MLPWFENGRFPLYLAPMAGFTDSVFRRLCREMGADVLVTEFVFADAILFGSDRAWETISFTPEERPVGVQIFGSSPENLATAAQRIEERTRPDFIDLNFGCPAPKVTHRLAGCALLRDLPRMGRIARAVRAALRSTPLTAKIRIGWDERSVVAVQAARVLEDAGVEALAVHGRTRVQGYRGSADWRVITEVAASTGLPVVGNGSIDGSEASLREVADAGIRGAMIGRAALGNPWIFARMRHRMEGRGDPPEPTVEERMSVLLRYAGLLQKRPNKRRHTDSIRWMSPRLKAFVKDMPGAARFRHRIESARSFEDLCALAANFSGIAA